MEAFTDTGFRDQVIITHPCIGCIRFMQEYGLKIPTFSRPVRYMAKWNGRKKAVVISLGEGREDTTIYTKHKIGRKRGPNT